MATVTPHPLHSSKLRHPLHALAEETHVLLEVERVGDEPVTPLLAIAIVACVIAPILVLMMVLAFSAASLFG